MKDCAALLHHNDLKMLMPMQKQDILLRLRILAFIEEQPEGIGFLFKLGIFLKLFRIGHALINSHKIRL
ncbi:hypothetical protein D3C73_1540080 [compost metagenome]